MLFMNILCDVILYCKVKLLVQYYEAVRVTSVMAYMYVVPAYGVPAYEVSAYVVPAYVIPAYVAPANQWGLSLYRVSFYSFWCFYIYVIILMIVMTIYYRLQEMARLTFKSSS